MCKHLDPETHAAVSTSHDVFPSDQFGTFPEEHTQSGIRSSLGNGLPMSLDTRAQDALNTHDPRLHEERILEQREVFRLETVDHGEVVSISATVRWRP
jgi:hypothetical protein